MLHSMTGFASLPGTSDRFAWVWELRSVNGKGLDIRLRLPDWIEGLEAEVRGRLLKSLSRGNVSASLRLRALPAAGAASLDTGQVDATLSALHEIEVRAAARGVALTPSSATDILAVRGVFDETGADDDSASLRRDVLAAFDTIITDFVAARKSEGAALAGLLERQVDQIAALVEEAGAKADARRPDAEVQFRAALARVMDATDRTVDETRIAQELALLAVKSDVTEELDRLRAHCDAARALLAEGSPVGRKLDFLAQEFNREANTLCSKSQNSDLTATGLELRSVIDQMREQVQNVE